MHLDYTLKLPDHQFVVAASHKLKPSVYALCTIKPTLVGFPEAVGYVTPVQLLLELGRVSTTKVHLQAIWLI